VRHERGASRHPEVVLDRIGTFNLPADAHSRRTVRIECGARLALRARVCGDGADCDTDAAAVLGRGCQVDLNKPMPWPDGTFDAVISTEGIEHLESHYTFLAELRRVLRPVDC
jgi:hypothetical protein